MISSKFQQALAIVAEARVELDEAEAECNRIIGEQQAKLGEIRAQKRQLDLIEGKSETTARRQATASSAARAPRGEMQSKILSILADNPAGLTRGSLIEKMEIKGNKAAEASLSNALVTLKKNTKVTSDRGRYIVAQPG